MSYFDDNEDRIIYGGRRVGKRAFLRAQHERDNATCKRCGAHPLKLRMNDNGKWQLFEQARGEHNRNVAHECNPVTADDFEVLS